MENQKNKNGTFKKGHTMSKGRPKGSKNKVQSEIRDFFANFVLDNMEQLYADFQLLDPKERFRYIIEISKFTIPNLKSIELSSILESISDEDFEKLMIKIKTDYGIN